MHVYEYSTITVTQLILGPLTRYTLQATRKPPQKASVYGHHTAEGSHLKAISYNTELGVTLITRHTSHVTRHTSHETRRRVTKSTLHTLTKRQAFEAGWSHGRNVTLTRDQASSVQDEVSYAATKSQWSQTSSKRHTFMRSLLSRTGPHQAVTKG